MHVWKLLSVSEKQQKILYGRLTRQYFRDWISASVLARFERTQAQTEVLFAPALSIAGSGLFPPETLLWPLRCFADFLPGTLHEPPVDGPYFAPPVFLEEKDSERILSIYIFTDRQYAVFLNYFSTGNLPWLCSLF